MEKRKILSIACYSVIVVSLTIVMIYGIKTGFFGIKEAMEGRDLLSKTFNVERSEAWDSSTVVGFDVNWLRGNVEFVIVSGNYVKITEYSENVLSDNEEFALSSTGGVLKINWTESPINIEFINRLSKNLVIEIPKTLADALEILECRTVSGDIALSEISTQEMSIISTNGDIEIGNIVIGENGCIDNTSGDTVAENIKAEHLVVSSISGDLQLENSEIKKIEVSSTSGGIIFSGIFEDIKSSAVSSETVIRSGFLPHISTMSSVSGDIRLIIPESDGFTAEYSSVSGRFLSDFAKDIGNSGKIIYKSGDSQLVFSTTSGDMKIERLPEYLS